MTTILPFPSLDPPMPRAWLCHCGKSSVGVCCWNCRQPRPVEGESGAVDEGGAECYNDGTSGVQGAGGNSIAKSGKGVWKRLETASLLLGPFLGPVCGHPLPGASNRSFGFGSAGRSAKWADGV